jgi:hypothetical protein
MMIKNYFFFRDIKLSKEDAISTDSGEAKPEMFITTNSNCYLLIFPELKNSI